MSKEECDHILGVTVCNQEGYFFVTNVSSNRIKECMSASFIFCPMCSCKIPNKKKGWINLYPDGHSTRAYLFLSTNVYKTKKEAFESRVNSSKSIQIEIEWEE